MKNMVVLIGVLAATITGVTIATGQSRDPGGASALVVDPSAPPPAPSPTIPALPASDAASPAAPPALIKPVLSPAATYRAECGACHIAFPVWMLPSRSWTAIMAGLSAHFGESADLDADTTERLRGFLEANAADAKGGARRVLRGLKATDAPLRITEMPFWIRIHTGEVSPAAFKRPKVKSKSNCGACHAGAAADMFGDD